MKGGRGGHSKSVIFEEQENQIEADRMAIARLLTKQEKLSVRIVELEDQLNRRPVPMPMPRSPLKSIYINQLHFNKIYFL